MQQIKSAFSDHAAMFKYNADTVVAGELSDIYETLKKKQPNKIAEALVDRILGSGIIQLTSEQEEESLEFWKNRISMIQDK